ncbi:MAG: M3 family metallopeptidase [Gemmatimonadota bacterium]
MPARSRFYILTLALLATACSREPTTTASSENPFFQKSTLPFQAPPFDHITDADYQPAIEAGMQQQRAEIDSIAHQEAPPTFENTIVAMERSGQLLTRVMRAFNAVTSANTDSTLQAVQAEEAPKLAAHSDAIYLDPDLYGRVKSIYERRQNLGLDSVQVFLVERYHKDFIRAGAELSDAAKDTLRALNEEESRLSTRFQTELLAGRNAAAVTVTDSSQLAGLSEAGVAAAADEAKSRDVQGWVLALQNTTQQPVLASLRDRGLRERIMKASLSRGDGGEHDTRPIVQRLAQLRAQKARILGYATYADYVLDDQMAKTPQAAEKLLTDLVPAATAKAHDEAAKMQAIVDGRGKDFQLASWDWQLYAEQLRKQEYDLDQSEVRPYLELNHVLEDGVFFAAHQLYGLTFKERTDIPVYNPDVRVFEVFDADGTSLALFYADYFARASKSGGAWMDNLVDQSGLLDTKAVVYNVCNFQKPAPGQPALLSFDDVTTMFHEFGHALHGMFSDVRYPTLAGTNVPRDFVEFPSQFNEHWALEPTVLANYAKRYDSGAPMPQELVDKIRRSSTFNMGYATTEYLEAALLDMAWHTLPADAPKQDVDAFETQALERFKVHLTQVPPRYRTTYFSHIWNGGYAAGYYAYMWSEVLDDDAYYWFRDHGGMTRENGQRFRDMILSRGGSEDVAAMYRAFRGRDPSVQPLLEERGLTGGN